MLQAQLQQLSQQVNQQVSVYTGKGFQVQDISSGMTHGSGKHCLPADSQKSASFPRSKLLQVYIVHALL